MAWVRRYCGVKIALSALFKPRQNPCQIMSNDFGLISNFTRVFDRAGVPDISVTGDNSDLVEVDPHDLTTTSEPEAPMQSLNQLPMVTDCWGHASSPKVLQEETPLANPFKRSAEATTHEASVL
jgi:hypothetical protein